MSGAEWRPVKGYDGRYEVSARGDVISLLREHPYMLSPFRNRKGYRRVCLYRDGKGRAVNVATVVLEAFVGPRPAGFHASHLDSNNQRDLLSNLAWESASANERRKAAHGRHAAQKRTHCPKGHPLVPGNLRANTHGWRMCLTCLRESGRERRRRAREARTAAAILALPDTEGESAPAPEAPEAPQLKE